LRAGGTSSEADGGRVKSLELNMLKFRAWQLASGEWLVLRFIRKADDRLELLSEDYLPDEDAVKEAIKASQEHLLAATKEAGFPDAKTYAQFPGAKKA
jgi:hypothetical protein